jgi:hypothetical protein
MADFISIHPEEWAGIIDGLYFSSMASTVLPLFLPVVIFALGLSLFIWMYRLEREGELTNFILWLVVSSVLLIAAFKKTKVYVELAPIVSVNPQAIMSFKNVKQDPKKNTFIYQVDASGAAALLAIPDKIASLFFNFLDEGFVRQVSRQSKTVPIDYLACIDPRYATATIQTLVLTEVFDLSTEKKQGFQDFLKKVSAFKKCYEERFDPDVEVSAFHFNFSWEKFKKMLAKATIGAGAGALVGSKFFPGLGTLIGGGLGFIGGLGLEGKDMVEFRGATKCSDFLEAYKKLAEGFARACDREFLPGMLGKTEKEKDEMKKRFANIVLACVQNPEADKSGFCSNLRNSTLYALEEAQKLSNVQITPGRGGIIGPFKDFLSTVVSDIKLWWYTTTYMDFPMKVALLAKGQGIVLAILIGVFPFIVVLSIIPTGNHFMNWPLLLKVGVAYFLVKLWLPLLYLIVNLAVHLFAGLSAGG